MQARLQKIPATLPGIIWILITTFLLCMPGEKIPSGGFFNIPHLDKFVHFLIFSVGVIAWVFYFLKKKIEVKKTRKILYTSMWILGYGILMEFVQHYLIPHRSFDFLDIIADAAGCLAGLWLGTIWAKKNRPL